MRKLLIAAVALFGLGATSANAMEFHLGFQGGYAWSESDVSIPNYPSNFDMDVDGWSAGAFGGVDWPINERLSIGVEADANWTESDGSNLSGLGAELYLIEQKWTAALRGRVSYEVRDGLEAYGAVGITWTEIETNYSPGAFSDDDDVLQGWTVAAGVEKDFGSRWFARAEYRYSDYDDGDFNHAGPSSADLTSHAVLFGGGMKF